MTSKFWPQFAAPENVELCLDLILKGMGLDYIDLYLVHWPYAIKSISNEALKNAKAGPEASDEQLGMVTKDGEPVIDWVHTSTNVAKQAG